MEDAEFKRLARLDAAKRVYKSMHPGDFPKNELEVIPWVNRYEEYIAHLHGDGDKHKVQHIKSHVPPRVQGFIENRNTWKDKKSAILNLTGPSAETVLSVSKKLTQEPTEDAHKFCQRVLEMCEQIGKTNSLEITNIYKDGLISGVREKITNLGQLRDINEIATQAQAAYQSFKLSCDNSERLNTLEARLVKQMGDTSAQQMKQLVSMLAVQDPQVPTATTYLMSEPVAYVNSAQFPGHVAGHTQTAAVPQGAFRPIAGPPPAPPASNQGRAQVQCWNCGGDHYKSGCPLLPRPSRRTWDTGDLAQGLNYYDDCTPAVSYGHPTSSYGRTGGYAAGHYYGNDGNHGMQGNSSWGGFEKRFRHLPRGYAQGPYCPPASQRRGINAVHTEDGDKIQAILDVINTHQGN